MLPDDAFETTEGFASINMWEQSHAFAMESLRDCRAFVLVTLAPGSMEPTFHTLSRDLSFEGMQALLTDTAEAAAEAADAVPCENGAS
jgi:hypothetical protein